MRAAPPSARQLPDHQRTAVAAYFSLYRGQEKDIAKIAISASLHPAAQRAYTTLKSYWVEVRPPLQRAKQ